MKERAEVEKVYTRQKNAVVPTLSTFYMKKKTNKIYDRITLSQ